MRDREPETFGRESQATDARDRVECAQFPLAGLREGCLARRPGDRVVGSERDLVDPTFSLVGRDHVAAPVRVGDNDLAVVAAGRKAVSVAVGAQDRAGMNAQTLRAAVRCREQDRFLAEDEGRLPPKKMQTNDGGAIGRDRLGAGGDGRCRTGVGHSLTQSSSP